MRRSSHFRLSSAKGFACCIGLVAQLAWTALGQNTVTLTDNNSSVRIDPYSQRGIFDWSAAQQNLLEQRWYWYRLGGAVPQQSIDTISAPVVRTYGTREASIQYTANNFILSVDELLTGGSFVPPGQSPNSDLGESIRIQNTSNQNLEFHFFRYSHSDLNGYSMDSVQLGRNLRGQFNDAFQQSPSGGLTDTLTTPGASHGEAGFSQALLQKLSGLSGYNLNDNAGPLGPGDVAYAFQWDFDIAPGASKLISMDSYLSVIIPEPSRAALLICGLVFFAVRLVIRKR